MKKTYEKPTLVRRELLVNIAASGPNGGFSASPDIT